MKNYLNLLEVILKEGVSKEDRTGIGTKSIFGHQMRFDLQKGFPLLTTKKLHIKSIIHELIWFLKGDTNIKYLNDNGVSIWNEWANSNGDLGPIYGHQWRNWQSNNETIDQISQVIHDIKNNPNSRRLVVNAWNVGFIKDMALPPCHILFQFYVANGRLSCQLYQRSCDAFLGLPFNIASYSLLMHMIAKQTGLDIGEFVWTGGDVHLYNNHLEKAKEQLKRDIRELPTIDIKEAKDIFSYKYEDIKINNYNPHPSIKAEIAV